MTMTRDELEKHKALLARMGMRYTEPFGPTNMEEPAVQTRMREVDETAHRVPSIFNLQNDFDLGNQVRMLTRDDSGHEAVVCAARDRIFGQSLRMADLEGALTRAAGELEEAADKFWVIHCNHPGDRCGRAQGEDKEFLATMHERSRAAAKTARAALGGAAGSTTVADLAAALDALLAATDPHRPGRDTEVELAAREVAVRTLNMAGFRTTLQKASAEPGGGPLDGNANFGPAIGMLDAAERGQ